MYEIVISLIAQCSCLISLCYSAEESQYLLWYIPNWVSSTLVILPIINKSTVPVLKVVFAFIIICNIIITGLFLERDWVQAAPATVSILLASVIDLQDPLRLA